MADIIGTNGDDILNGTADADFISGLSGNDTINGGDGDDFIYSGTGDDIIDGGVGNDEIEGDDGADTLNGGDGDDRLKGSAGTDTVFGGNGNDSLRGGSGSDVIHGGEGNDDLYSRIGNGDGLDDVDPDQIFGEGGNDQIIGGIGDILDGGTGTDTLLLDFSASTAGLTIDLAQLTGGGTVQLGTGSITGFEKLGTIVLSQGNDNVSLGSALVFGSVQGFWGNDTLTGGSGNDLLDGGDGEDTLDGGAGEDSLIGGSNIDTTVVSGNRSAYTVTQTTTGVFSVVGPDGTDTLSTIEFLQFADQLLRLLPGSGTAVNFTADPDTYMAAIRDFDGNNLGAGDGWLRIGAADVDGDGDSDQFFVNAAIGRFAEVATGPDGLVYFADHGWAGETRVVGIYIDPLVASGQVVAGGPFDSQTRFQNDLLIENINGVLGGADYDHDGLQEVYFKLTDGTAYLHAYMHADGNIRYANYQSQQQVIDYLTAEGWAPATWAGWFPANADGHQAAKTAPVFDPVDSFAFAREDFAGWTAELQSEPIYG